MKDTGDFEKLIGHTFANKDILLEALTHRSYLNENPDWKLPHNERLEFLGDAVLELAITEELYHRFPDTPEGRLTVLRAALVNYQLLGRVASDAGWSKHILLSRGEQGDTSKAREVILANAFEAVIGAVYLDGGYDAARAFIEGQVLPALPAILESKSYRDAKSELQERIQEERRITPMYKLLDESGPAHKRTFRMGVFVGGELLGEGEGNSKQEAETEAAKSALERLR
jgi:ribonuclease-3